MSLATDEKQSVEERAGALRERVTARALVIGVFTIVGMALFMSYFGRSLVKNYMPVAVALPFVVVAGDQYGVEAFRAAVGTVPDGDADGVFHGVVGGEFAGYRVGDVYGDRYCGSGSLRFS